MTIDNTIKTGYDKNATMDQRGVLQNQWFTRENLNLKWMRTGGTSTLGTPIVNPTNSYKIL